MEREYQYEKKKTQHHTLTHIIANPLNKISLGTSAVKLLGIEDHTR